MFIGTCSGLSWTNPGHENGYRYHVGMTAAVLEPEACALMFAGLGIVGWLARRRG